MIPLVSWLKKIQRTWSSASYQCFVPCFVTFYYVGTLNSVEYDPLGKLAKKTEDMIICIISLFCAMFCYVITSELSTVLSPPTQPNLDTYINFQISNGAYYAHLNLCFQPRDCLTTSLTNGSVSRTKHCPQYITLPKYDPLGKLSQKKNLKL